MGETRALRLEHLKDEQSFSILKRIVMGETSWQL